MLVFASLLAAFVLFSASTALSDEVIASAGDGGYLAQPPTGAKAPPDTIYATSAVKGKMPTNDWWMSTKQEK